MGVARVTRQAVAKENFGLRVIALLEAQQSLLQIGLRCLRRRRKRCGRHACRSRCNLGRRHDWLPARRGHPPTHRFLHITDCDVVVQSLQPPCE